MSCQKHEKLGWDTERPPPEVFAQILAAATHTVIWGGNYFADLLPPTMRWLVWDKMQGDFSLADCEFAWTSEQKAARIFRYSRGAALQDGKEHPTQKPIYLYDWIFNRFAKEGNLILDTHVGSGSSRIAAYKHKLDFVGFEIDKGYYEAQEKRFNAVISQQTLF